MNLPLLLLIASFFSISGDVICKYGATLYEWEYWCMLGTALCWGGAGSIIWTTIYKGRSIAEMVVIYNPAHAIMLATVGVLFFQDTITLKMILAATLAGISMWLML
jgi:hypothetical protein